jgi:polyribonucleotide nucleotidyltransferase
LCFTFQSELYATREITVGQNTLKFETGKLAKQAHGSVIVRYGDSVVLVTACRAANPREGIDFLPLTVDYREYTYASGASPAASSSAKASRPKRKC